MPEGRGERLLGAPCRPQRAPGVGPAEQRHPAAGGLRPVDGRPPAGARAPLARPRDRPRDPAVADGGALHAWRDPPGRLATSVARQVLAPPRGFVWAATARFIGIPVIGFDRLSSGSGQMRWRLGGLVPVVSATGPDVTRSAAGRLAGETVLVPTTSRAAT